jgi:hypothetical protein
MWLCLISIFKPKIFGFIIKCAKIKFRSILFKEIELKERMFKYLECQSKVSMSPDTDNCWMPENYSSTSSSSVNPLNANEMLAFDEH